VRTAFQKSPLRIATFFLPAIMATGHISYAGIWSTGEGQILIAKTLGSSDGERISAASGAAQTIGDC
jgi:hypothetical protein